MYRFVAFLAVLGATGALLVELTSPPGTLAKDIPMMSSAALGAMVAGHLCCDTWLRKPLWLPLVAAFTTILGGTTGGIGFTLLTMIFNLSSVSSEAAVLLLMSPFFGGAFALFIALKTPITFAVWVAGMVLAAGVIRYHNPQINP